jgi:putative ABC transport system permease protein
MRNIFLMIAIALTALLFTTLFSMASGAVQITQEQTMRKIGTRGHAGLKNVTREQYEKITSHPLVKGHSYNIFIAKADNKELIKRQTEIRYAEKKDLEYCFITLKEGKLPEKENEVVVDTMVMDLLGVPHELGAELTLSYPFLGKELESSFTISGWYQSDLVSGASQVYVSRAYLDKISEGYTEEDFVESFKAHNEGSGLYQGCIMFSNSRNIEANIVKVITESGYSAKEINYGINWAYFSDKLKDMDLFSVIILTTAFLIIMLTGYLIIYNIFQISIIGDIRYYGLLKTIGTTKRQIKSLILRQALLLSCIGIPLGLLFGFLIANVGMPILLKAISPSISTTGFHLNANPYIFLFATLFSFATVLISCLKPGRIAGSVSPIEAAKYSEISKVNNKKKITTGGAKLPRMALSNLRRNRKKTIFTILSLSLSVVLLTEVVTFSKSFSMDEYLEMMLTGDFMIGSVSLTNFQAKAPLTLPEDFYKAASSQEGIEGSARLYTTAGSVSHSLTPEGYRRFKEFYDADSLTIRESEGYTNRTMLKGVVEENDPIEEVRYAYDDSLLKKLKVLDGTFDLEKFKSGDYILVGALLEKEETYYKPGDKVKLSYHSAASKQVMLYDKEGKFKQNAWENDTSK